MVCTIPLFPNTGSGQLLYDVFEGYEDYQNYAMTGYRPYETIGLRRARRPVWDTMGNFLMDGLVVWQSDEGRPTDPRPGSLVDKSNEYTSMLNNLVVARDTYKNWSSRLLIGNRIRTKFTSLTLDMVQLNGVRWDVDLNPTQLTFVSSRFDWPIFGGRVRSAQSSEDNEEHRARQRVTYLLGGHIERQFGALNLAFSYVNLHRTDSLVDWGANSLKGVLPAGINQPPAYIAVKISDGSDRDGGGARVFDLRIDGELNDQVAVSITRHDARQIDPTYPNKDRFFLPDRTIPPYVQFLRGNLPQEGPGEKGFLEVNGSEFLVYWFEIPQEMRGEIESIRFEALVSNDYQIDLSEIYLPTSQAIADNPFDPNIRATYFYPVAAQEGNVQDRSNFRWVDFVYGRQTGRTTTSLRLEFDREGLQVRSEFARSFEFRQYPSSLGRNKWQRETADAFFVTAKKQLGSAAAVGGEYFRIDPQYSTALSIQDKEYESYSDRLGSPFPEVFPDWGARYNYTLELDTVDDNDDKDLWPDFHFLNETFGDQDGVFPGRDRDLNGLTDTNENGNRLPDYLEPFLLYKVDPPEFDYGDDLNNNGVIDHREDDRKPDHPYDIDLEGHHLFVDLDPAKALRLRFGRYRTQEIWGAGQNRVTYSRVNYRRNLFPHVRIDFTNFLKRVRDDIEDDTPQFVDFAPNFIPIGPASLADPSSMVLVEDPLLMRNSWVNTSFVDASYLKIKDLKVNNRIKYTLNFQRPSTLQQANTLREWSWVLRTDYQWKLAKLSIAPKVKYMVYRRKDDKDVVTSVSERFFYPIAVANYALTSATTFSAGAQGFPFLKSTYRNARNSQVDYATEDYILSVTNRTTFSGYHLSLNLGYHLQRLQFEDKRRHLAGIDRSLFFVRLVMGLEPFQG